MKQKTTSFLLAGLYLLITSAASAQNVDTTTLPGLPDYYPADFHATGILHSVDLQQGILVINATQYHYITNVKVHSLNTEHSSLRALKPGTGLGYTIVVINNKQLISEIWTLPAKAVILR